MHENIGHTYKDSITGFRTSGIGLSSIETGRLSWLKPPFGLV